MKLPPVAALLVVVMTAAASAAHAQAAVVSSAWVRGTVPGQTSAGAYMQLSSAQGAIVIGVESPAAGIAEIHEMRMEGDTMRMRSVDKLELPPGRTVELKPGGYHVMLMDLKTPLKRGDAVPITLKVRGKSGQVENVAVRAEVRDAPAGTAKH